LLTPNFDEKEVENPAIFLHDKTCSGIEGRVEIENDDYSHSLGERFTVRYRIQYVKDTVTPNFENVFNFVNFEPFEIEGEPKISHERVSSSHVRGDTQVEIFEYVYEVKLFLVTGLVSKLYELPFAKVDYVSTSSFGGSNTGGSIYLRPLMSINITRNVTEPESAIYADLKNAVKNNNPTIKELFLNAGRLLNIATLLFVAWWVLGYKKKKVSEKVALDQELLVRLGRFEDSTWLKSDSAVNRMRELAAIALRAAYVFNKIQPVDFYDKFADGELGRLFDLVEGPSAEAVVTTLDVLSACALVREKLGDNIVNKKNKRSVKDLFNNIKLKTKKGGK